MSLNSKQANGNPKARKFLIPRFQRWSFLIQFTIMTLLGWIVGGIASIAIEKTLVEVLPPVILQQKIWYALAKYFSDGVFALIFGADQALILRQYISGWLWMFATSLGWLIANSVSAQWMNYIAAIAVSLNQISPEQTVILGLLSTIAYILSGVWLGFCQWLVLRRYTKGAWWWNFVPSISFFCISLVIWLLSLVQQSIPEINRPQIIYLYGQAVTAFILGIIPAIGLCNLKIKSRPT
jgi:hypothetical protein